VFAVMQFCSVDSEAVQLHLSGKREREPLMFRFKNKLTTNFLDKNNNNNGY